MRKILWSLITVLIVLVIAFLLLPFFMGMLAENKFKQVVALLNNETPIIIEKINYQRGWFTSDATAVIALKKISHDTNDLNPQPLSQLAIAAHIAHGPLVANWQTFKFAQAIVAANINLNAQQNEFLKRSQDAGPIATAKITFQLAGTTRVAIDSSSLAYQDAENNIHWQGLKLHAKMSPFFNEIQAVLDFPGVDIALKDYNLHIAGVSCNYQGKQSAEGLWLGERNVQAQAFTTVDENKHTLALSGLNLHSVISDAKTNIDAVITVALDSLNLDGSTYNQNLLDVELNGLNKALLAKLQQQIKQNHGMSEGTAAQPTNNRIDTLIALLSNGGTINIKQLNTATPWGKLLAAIKIEFANQPANNGMLAIITNSNLNTDIKIERKLALYLLDGFYQKTQQNLPAAESAKRADDLLSQWQQSGKIASETNDPYLHFAIDYKDHQLLLNGKTLSLTIK